MNLRKLIAQASSAWSVVTALRAVLDKHPKAAVVLRTLWSIALVASIADLLLGGVNVFARAVLLAVALKTLWRLHESKRPEVVDA